MENLKHHELAKLLAQQTNSGPHVTLYVPTHRAATPPNMTEDQIRFKNLIHRAAEMLKARPDGQALATQLCNTLDSLMNDVSFWESQTEGLLLCANGNGIHMFHLPIDTEEYAAVDDEYHLAAALALIADERSYYVLALAQHKPSLFEGDMFDLRPTNLTLPESVEDGLNLDEPNQKSEQQRSDGGASSNTGGFNGRGGARDAREQDRLRFWRLIDQKIMEFADKKMPLILAGTGSEVAEFRGLSRHPNILDDCIEGSINGSSPHDWFATAQRIINKDITTKEHQHFLEEYTRLSGANPERVADRAEEITKAAEAGRIETLLLGIHRLTTDTVRDNLTPVPTISFPADAATKAMANHVAQQVFSASGHVVAIDQAAMPGRVPMVARLRY